MSSSVNYIIITGIRVENPYMYMYMNRTFIHMHIYEYKVRYGSDSHENPMKILWKTHENIVMAMKTEILKFMVCFRAMKLPWNSCWLNFMGHENHNKPLKLLFHGPWKFHKPMKFHFHGSWKVFKPLKIQLAFSIQNFMGHENLPWNVFWRIAWVQNPMKLFFMGHESVHIHVFSWDYVFFMVQFIPCGLWKRHDNTMKILWKIHGNFHGIFMVFRFIVVPNQGSWCECK